LAEVLHAIRAQGMNAGEIKAVAEFRLKDEALTGDFLRKAFPDDYYALFEPVAFARLKARLPFLEDRKVEGLKQLEDDHRVRADTIAQDSSGILLPEDREKLAREAQSYRESLQRILTAKELEEYDLRLSPQADLIRRQLAGFQPSEQEFRAILTLKADQTLGSSAESRPSASLVAADLAGILSPERLEDFARTTQPNYIYAFRLVTRLGLSPSVADEVTRIEAGFQQQAKRVAADAGMTSDQRQALINATKEEAMGALRQALGEVGFEAYAASTATGMWLKNPVLKDSSRFLSR
jgi:hypothetical protein